MTGPGGESPSFFSGARPALLLAAAAALLYAHTLSFGLVYFDDEILALHNAPVLSEVSNLGRLFATDVFLQGKSPYYRPVLNLSFMLDALIGGPPHFMGHLTNLLLHAAATVLLFLTLGALGAAGAPAFFLALAFAWHPSLVQAAAWLPGRNDSLLAVFALASFLLFLRWLRYGRGRDGAGAAVCFALALFTKETALALPFLSAFYAWRGGGFPSRGRRAAFWVAAAFLTGGWWLARAAAIPAGEGGFAGGALRTLANLPNLLPLLGKTVFPLAPQVWPTAAETSFLPGLAALLLVSAAFKYLPRNRSALFGLLWYGIFLVPTLASAGNNHGVLFWEHRLYLPLAGFAVFLSGFEAVGTAGLNSLRRRAGLALVLGALAVTSWTHSRVFSGRLAFWEQAAQEAPGNFTANLNLGYSAQAARLDGLAQRHYRAALLVSPGAPFIHKNLGILYALRGEAARARKEFENELAVNPSAYSELITYREEPRLERALRGLKPPRAAAN